MQKIKSNVFVIALIFLLIFLIKLNCVYAKNDEILDDWEVTITNDTKEIKDTHEIKFKVEKNKDVVPKKIAPGMKATAEIEINLEKVKGTVDVEVKIDDSKLNKVFKINTKLDGKTILTQKNTKIKAGAKRKILLELVWNENSIEDTNIGNNTETIEIPIQIRVLQHI